MNDNQTSCITTNQWNSNSLLYFTHIHSIIRSFVHLFVQFVFNLYRFWYSIWSPIVNPVILDFIHWLLYACYTFVSWYTVRLLHYLVSFLVLIAVTRISRRLHQQPHYGRSYCDVLFIKDCFVIDCYIVLFCIVSLVNIQF